MSLSKNGMMFVLSSPSGVGKTTLTKKISKNNKNFVISISHTTRKPRDSEIEGKDYFFINEKEFNKLIEEDSFFEHAKIFDNFYGTSKRQVLNIIEEGNDVLFDIDWQGAQQLVKSDYSKIVTIFILPPSKESIEKRLLMRKNDSGDNIETVKNRMLEYETEVSHQEEYKYIVINKDLDECTNEIIEIIRNEKL